MRNAERQGTEALPFCINTLSCQEEESDLSDPLERGVSRSPSRQDGGGGVLAGKGCGFPGLSMALGRGGVTGPQAQAAHIAVGEGAEDERDRKAQRRKATTVAVSRQTRLPRRQMPIFSASRTRSSRKSGWAIEMIASALSQVDLPLRLTMPYSVTT